jgi:uncharacterized protein YdeI (YjbR/CyaY-like superfamily)
MRSHTRAAVARTIRSHRIVRGMPDDLPVRHFATRGELAAWLADQCETSPGCWLKLARKGGGVESVSYAEAVELGLAHGWIDGQKRALDEQFWLQRFTPRGARSR